MREQFFPCRWGGVIRLPIVDCIPVGHKLVLPTVLTIGWLLQLITEGFVLWLVQGIGCHVVLSALVQLWIDG